MFELFEKVENIFDNWYDKGYLLIAAIILVLIAIYYMIKILV